MTVSSPQLARNVLSMTGAYVGRKILTFAYFTLIARFTNVEITGFYYLLISFTAVMTSIIDFGLTNTFIREGSRSSSQLEDYFRNTLGLKVVLAILAFGCGIFLLNILHYPTITKHLVLLVIATMACETISDTFYGCLRIMHSMQFEARALVLGQGITLLVGGLSLWLHPSLYLLVFALLLGQAYHLLYSLLLVRRRFAFRVRISLDWRFLRPLIGIALPFLIVSLFGQVLYANTFILKYLTTDRIVGLFAVPSAIMMAMRFIPTAMESAIFPALSSFHVTSKEKLQRTFNLFFEVLLVSSVPMTLIILFASDVVINGLYGPNYTESVPVLRLLIFSLIPFFLSHPIGRLLEACDRQITNTLLLGGCLLINLILTFLFIPKYGALGIALATLASHSMMLVVGLYFCFQIIPGSLTFLATSSLRIGLSAMIMLGSILLLQSLTLPLIVALVAGSLIYLLSLIFLRGLSTTGFSRERAFGEWSALTKRAIGASSEFS